MGYFNWQNTYSVGINEIDSHHKKLVEILNKLQEAVASDESGHKEIIPEILEEAFGYLDFHFRAEEKLMREYKYPDYKTHKSEHNDFVKKALKFQSDYNKGKSSVDRAMLDFLKDWLIKHILATDKRMGSYLLKKI